MAAALHHLKRESAIALIDSVDQKGLRIVVGGRVS
jgi:hypothetical protein